MEITGFGIEDPAYWAGSASNLVSDIRSILSPESDGTLDPRWVRFIQDLTLHSSLPPELLLGAAIKAASVEFLVAICSIGSEG